MNDEFWMTKALKLAEKGRQTTTPNPNVGCVIVRNNELLAEGFHAKAGQAHAEAMALAAGGDVRGATAFITLEPCAHHGRTPPCADALIAAGIARVVCAMIDPNPRVAGAGLRKLTEAGIATHCGVLQPAAERLNADFIKRMRTGLPFVIIKMAASLDGATALANGASQWITGPEARQDVQQERALSCAIVTGVDTVIADNPSLNVRLQEASRQPLRIILDSNGRTPLQAAIVAKPGDTLIIHGDELPAEQVRAFQQHGFQTQAMPLVGGRIDIGAFLQWCNRKELNRLWVEAGATLASAFIDAGIVDEIWLYQAPLFLGCNTRPLFKHQYNCIEDGLEVEVQDQKLVGKDRRLILIPKAR